MKWGHPGAMQQAPVHTPLQCPCHHQEFHTICRIVFPIRGEDFKQTEGS
jgi:hypothetical protein